MSARPVIQPFEVFRDVDGTPLESGAIYIGTANIDPVANPIPVFWDEALTIAAAQPITTINGYPSRGGSPGRLFCNDDYSILVRNKRGELVSGAPVITDSGDTLRADLANTADPAKGASLVGWKQTGTGAVARTVGDKIRDTVSVKDFGAAGDGVTEDAVAIQSALTAAAGGTIVFPPGNYRVAGASAFTVPDNTTIIGYGSTITSEKTSDLFDLTGATGIRVNGLKMVGPVAGTYYAIRGTSITRLTVEDCEFTSWTSGINFESTDAILTDGGNDLLVTGCWFHDLRATGISSTRSDGFNIHHNRFEVIGSAPTDHGIYLAGSKNAVVSDNRFEDCSGFGFHLYQSKDDEYTENTLITGNIFRGAGIGAILVGGGGKNGTFIGVNVSNNICWSTGSGINMSELRGGVIENNLVQGCTNVAGAGIHLGGETGNPLDYNIIGNTIINCAGDGIRLGFAAAADLTKVSITENVITGNLNGIVVRSGYNPSYCKNMVVKNNRISTSGTGITAALFSNATNVIKDNTGIGQETKAVTVVSGAASYAPDMSLGDQIVRIILTQNITINASTNNWTGATIDWIFYQSGGPYTITWDSSYKVTPVTPSGTATRSGLRTIWDSAAWQQIGAQSPWKT